MQNSSFRLHQMVSSWVQISDVPEAVYARIDRPVQELCTTGEIPGRKLESRPPNVIYQIKQ
jgi:hypothetical protein